MDPVEREVQDFERLVTQIASEADNSAREKLEANLMIKINSATLIIIMKRVLPSRAHAGIHTITASLLKYYVKNKLSSPTVTQVERAAVLEDIFKLIFMDEVDLKIKETLVESVKLILIKAESANLEKELRKGFVELIFREMTGVRKSQYISGLICLNAVVKTLQNVISIGEFYKDYRVQIGELGVRVLTFLEPEFSAANTNPNFAELTESSLVIQNYSLLVLNLFINLTTYKCYSMTTHFLNRDTSTILDVVNKMFDFSLTPGGNNILGVSRNEDLNEAFNRFKDNIVVLYIKILKYIVSGNTRGRDEGSKSDAPLNTKHLCTLLSKKSAILIESIYEVYKNPNVNLETIEEIDSLNEVLISSMKLLSKLANETEFYSIFDKVGKQLFIDIILVNLILLPREMDNFTQNEKEFCESFHDLCFEQKSHTLKSYSMRLLETMVEKIDWYFAYVSGIIIGLLDCTAAKTGFQEAEALYPNLTDLRESKFLKNTDEEKRLDVCLLVICSTSFYIILRPERFLELRACLARHISTLMSFSPLILCRIMLLGAFVFEGLISHENSRKAGEAIFKAIFSTFDPSNSYSPAIRYQAINTLLFMISTSKSRAQIADFKESLIRESCGMIYSTKYDKYFDVVLKIFSCEFCSICVEKKDLLSSIVKALVSRIQQEVVEPTDKLKKNVFLFKCWNILRAICENQEFIPKFLNEIDNLLLPVLSMIEQPVILEFEDDIIEILNSTVSLSKRVSPNLAKVVYLFPSIAKKFDQKAAQLYTAYNVLLQYGIEIFNDPRLISDMIEVGIFAMEKASENQREFDDVFMTEGVMILHLAVHFLHPKLSEQNWLTIFQAASRGILPQESKQLQNYYKARLFGLFLSALYFNRVVAITYLVKTNTLEPLITSCVNKSAYFITDYDRKLLVLGLMSVFDEKFKGKQFDELAKQCLEFSILILHVQRIEQNKATGFYKSKIIKSDDETQEVNLCEMITQKFKLLAGIADDDEASDDEFDDEIDDDNDVEEMEVLRSLMSSKGKAKISLKNFTSPIKNENEFDYFINILKQVKANLPPESFAKLLGELSEVSRTALHGISQCQTVNVFNHKNQKVDVARKIAKVKRPGKPVEGA